MQNRNSWNLQEKSPEENVKIRKTRSAQVYNNNHHHHNNNNNNNNNDNNNNNNNEEY